MSDVQAFITRWRASGASERANYQLFLSELCAVIGAEHPEPASDVSERNTYTFERAVTLDDGEGKTSTGFIDLYRKGSFVLEAKQGSDDQNQTEEAALGLAVKRKTGTAKRGTRFWELAMKRAKEQALRYARSLPEGDGWPPFLLVVDVGYCIDVYADFARQGKTYVPFPDPVRYRIMLEDLARSDVREMLRMVWTDPMALDPTRRSARVTRELAGKLARLASSMESAGYAPDAVARFLMRCLFTMFAEDVGLLPERSFTRLLLEFRSDREVLPDALRALWQTMNTGGFLIALHARVEQFNGGLFKDAAALPLSEAQIDLLVEAAKADWKDVEPAIFGTLLERALDPVERHKLGAHYTPRAYVERLVMPTIIEPLREEWTAAQTAAAAREAAGDEVGARSEIEAFHRRLCSVRVLDPACGSGNFLYVTLEHLKRLEGEVLKVMESYGGQQMLDMTHGFTVSPAQLLGLEVNPRAAAIADVVLWIGYLQWHFRTHGSAKRLDPPILREYKNIRHQDAVLAYDERVPRLGGDGNPITRWDGRTTKPHPVTGEAVPDDSARVPVYDYTNTRPAEWPEADYIVGNPPFVGNKRMRLALGDGYVEALRQTYRNRVPDSADFVMYWWHKAAEIVQRGSASRLGLITTNSLSQTYNRVVVESHLDGHARSGDGLALTFAVPDHPWVDDTFGAAVRISMTVAERGVNAPGRLAKIAAEEETDDHEHAVALIETTGVIHADLSLGADVTSAKSLKANEGLSNRGVIPHGAGFLVTPQEAKQLGLGSVDGLEQFIRPYRNGRDLTAKPRGVLALDFFGLTANEVLDRYPAAYQWLLERVKPERDLNNRKSRRENWWLFAESQPRMRASLLDLNRYIVTPQVSKHRLFQFLDTKFLPDDKLIVIALNDAYYLGILSSAVHIVWALAAGSRLGVGNDPVYDKTQTFEAFPFPAPSEEQREHIRNLAERLDLHRKRVQITHSDLTLTGLYNVLGKVRAGDALSDGDRDMYKRGLVGILKALHDELDAAAAAAYGWPTNLSDAEILERLVALNHKRAEEEAASLIRYLRPDYQNPQGAQQATLDIKTAPKKKRADGKAEKQLWPKALAAQAQAVQRVLAAHYRPATPSDVAKRFKRAKLDQVAQLLETLEALGHARRTGEGAYIV